jgi:DNA-binding HxlR family transcriptional regulator
MTAYTPSRAPCPIGRAARILGDRWAILILREAFLGVDRFDLFLDRLKISRAALSDRLAMLVAAGVLMRDPPSGKRAVYRLTESGKDLSETLAALKNWGDRWLFDSSQNPHEKNHA